MKTSLNNIFQAKHDWSDWVQKAPELIEKLIDKTPFNAQAIRNETFVLWAFAVSKEGRIEFFGIDEKQMLINYHPMSVHMDNPKHFMSPIYVLLAERGWIKLDITLSFTRLEANMRRITEELQYQYETDNKSYALIDVKQVQEQVIGDDFDMGYEFSPKKREEL